MFIEFKNRPVTLFYNIWVLIFYNHRNLFLYLILHPIRAVHHFLFSMCTNISISYPYFLRESNIFDF